MSGLGPVRLAVRGLRPGAGISALLALLVLVGAFLAIGAPRSVTGVLTSALHDELRPISGQLALDAVLPDAAYQGSAGIGPLWNQLGSRLSAVRADRLSALGPIVEPGGFTGRARGAAATGMFGSGTPTTHLGDRAAFTLEAAPSLRDEAKLVSGRWPGAPTAGGPIEVVISAKAAAAIRWEVGQEQTLDGTHPTVLVGIVAPRDPGSAFWRTDPDRADVGTERDPIDDSVTYLSTIWVDAASWPTLAPTLAGRSISAWYGIDVDRITADRAPVVAAQVRRFLALPPDAGGRSGESLAFGSDLPADLLRFTDQSAPSTALIALFALGPAGALAAVLLLGSRLLRSRRSASEAVARARGGSAVQLRLLAAAEIAIWTVPAAAVGAIAAVLLTPGAGPLSGVIVAAVLCALVAPLAAAFLPRSDGAEPRSRASRLAAAAAEAAVVLIAVLALVVLLARGPVAAGSGEPGSGETPPGVDPLVEAAPLLLAVAITLLALRAMPFLAGWLGALQRRGRSAVGLVAASGSGLAVRGSAWILFALVVGVGMTVFSLTMVATQQHGVTQAALNTTGGEVAVGGIDLDDRTVDAIDRLPGVAAHASVQLVGTTTLSGSDIAVYAVDVSALAAVQRGIDASPLAVVRGSDALVTSAAGPPATAHVDDTRPDRLRLHPVDGRTVSFVLDEPRWVLVDRASLVREDTGGSAVGVLLRLRPGADPAAVAADVQKLAGPKATIRTAAAAEQSLLGTPLDAAVRFAILAATILSALLCVLVFSMTLAGGAAERLRRGAILRALGFGRRQTGLLVLSDVIPTAVLGVVVGAATGVGLAAVVVHAIDPTGFVGSPVPPTLALDLPTTLLALVGFLGVVVVAAAVAMIVDSTRPATDGLQTLGEER